jgi:hypothetical protein
MRTILQEIDYPDPVLATPRPGKEKPEQAFGFGVRHSLAGKYAVYRFKLELMLL